MAKIKLRRDTAANWTTANPVLAAGEPGLETDTQQIKYGDGVTAWTSLAYAGGNGDSLTSDTAISVTTGGSDYWVAYQTRQDTDGSFEFEGVEQILPESLRYDSQGNLVVLADVDHTDSGIKVLTKYSSTGEVLWQRGYEHAETIFEPKSVVIDSNDDIYVSGDVYSTDLQRDVPLVTKFSGASGSIIWSKTYAVARDTNDVHVDVFSDDDLVLVWEESRGYNEELDIEPGELMIAKLSADNGNVQWIYTYGEDYLDVDLFGVTVDSDDNVIVSVSYSSSGNAVNVAAVIKVNSSGELQWQKYFEDFGGADYNVRGGDLATDSLGNVYGILNYEVPSVVVVGTGNYTAALVYKITSAGSLSWSRKIGPGPCGSVASAIDVDEDDYVYVAASTFVKKSDQYAENNEFERFINGDNKMILASYTTDGTVRWQRYVDIQGLWENNEDYDDGTPAERGQQLSVRNGKIAVTGSVALASFFGGPAGNTLVFVAQLPASGDPVELGKDTRRLAFKESRVPGRLTSSTLSTALLTYASDSTVPLAVVDTDTENLPSPVANETFGTEPYVYTFGSDGTLTIPNDGDIQLTQTVKGWFTIYGDIINNSYDREFRAVTHDALGNLIAVGEDDDVNKSTVVKFDTEGNVLWSVELTDDIDSANNLAQAVMLDSNGDIVVTCLVNGFYTRSVVFLLDQDTGRIKEHSTISDADSDVQIVDTAKFSNGTPVYAGYKNGEFKDFTVDTQTGSGTGVLVILASEVDTPPETSNWFISGNAITPEEIVSVNSYSSITGTVREGSGASFDIDDNGNGTYGAAGIVIGGSNYLVGHKILIPGTGLGGVSPDNDCVVTVTNTSAGAITAISVSGTAAGVTPANYLSMVGTNYQVGSGAEFTVIVNPETGSYSVDAITNGGSNYVVGDVITVLGTEFIGGATSANDLTITVDGVSGGVVAGVVSSGTADLTYYKLATGGVIAFNSQPSWTVSYSLNNESLIVTAGWQRAFGGGRFDEGTDRLYSVAVDSNNNVYAVGNSEGGVEDLNGYLMAVLYKFNSTGTLQWAKTLNHDLVNCAGRSVAVSGGTVITTHTNDGNGITVITAFDATGAVLWQRRTDSDYDSSLAVDSSGNIYALIEAFNQYEENGNGWDSLKLIKFNSLGTVIWKRWIGTERSDSLRFNRTISVDSDYVYIAGRTTATEDDYLNCFAARVPTDGSGMGQYGHFFYTDKSYTGNDGYQEYTVETIENTDYVLDQTVEVDTNDSVTIDDSGEYIVDWYEEGNYVETIKDQSGGQIRFADGTTQDTTAQDVPQINVQGRQYKLGMGDRGRHLYVTDGSASIIVPYHASVPLPIGTTVTVINDNGDGNNIDIEAEGGGSVTLINPGNGSGSYYILEDGGIATLIKVQNDRWFITGGPGYWD